MKAMRTLFTNVPVVELSCISLLFLGTLVLNGCGSSTNSSATPKLQGNTNVTLVLSSTANDQLSEFGIVLQGVTLTTQSGKSATLFSGMAGQEFIVINGGAYPLATATIPQDVYTGATVTLGSAQFNCVTVAGPTAPNPGGLVMDFFAYGQVPADHITVTLPSPVTVTGKTMDIRFDLSVAQSATFSGCGVQSNTWAITPTFNVTAMPVASQPTNAANGKVVGMIGEAASLNSSGNGFMLTLPQAAFTCPCPAMNSVSINVDSNTQFQGIANFSAITPNTFVDVDGALQADGSLLATRIASYDTGANNVMTGPLLYVSSSTPQFETLGRQQQGQNFSQQPLSRGGFVFNGSTLFKTSGEFLNLTALPFVPDFSSASMVAGQNVSAFLTSATTTTMVLMPQTINGTVVASSSAGTFTDYSVLLDSSDLFPALAVQPGQAMTLNHPGQADVYVDASTQRLNMQPLAPGNTLRFRGLVFNDNGTLRMDCSEVNDGVPLSSQSSSSSASSTAMANVTSRIMVGSPGQTPVTIRSHTIHQQ